MSDKITKALETVNELHGETLEQLEDDLPLVGYLITVSAILRSERREEWAEKIGIAASKINEMQNEIRILQEIVREDMKELVQYRAENEKLRAALKPFADRYAYTRKYCPDRGHMPIGIDDLRAAAKALGDKDNA